MEARKEGNGGEAEALNLALYTERIAGATRPAAKLVAGKTVARRNCGVRLG